MAKGSATQAANAAKIRQNLMNDINATNKFAASIKTIKTTAESFTESLEKNKLSMGQYFKYAGGASKSFGKLFKNEMATIDKVARERVKTLQTQYIQLGRDASGAMKSIAVRPLVLDMDNYATKTAIAAQKQQILNQLLKQGSTNLLNFGKNTQWAGRQLMVGFTVPLAMAGTAAAKTYMEMEKAVVKFKRVYGDLNTTGAETAKTLETLRQLSGEFTKYGIAVADTMDMAAQAAATGKMGADLIAQVQNATKLAVLGGVEQSQALETTISLTNAFGVAAEDLAGKIDFLNAVENQTVTSIEDLTIAIPKAAPVIQQLGGDVKDLAFFLTAMREGGINASEGANALKSGLASMINPTKQASEFLAGFGISVKGIVEGTKGDVKQTILQMATAFDTLDPLNRARAIEQMFGKFQFARISTLFQNVIKEGSQAQTVLDLSRNTAEELAVLSQRELGKISESPMFKFQKTLEDIQAKIAPIGEAFLKMITPIIEWAGTLIDNFNNMGKGVKDFWLGLVAGVAGLGPVLLMGFGLIANGVANLIKLFANIKSWFNKTSDSTTTLGMQTSYMSQEQLEAAAVAASLDQAHSSLVQTFTSEALAVDKLRTAYEKAILAQQQFSNTNVIPTTVTPRNDDVDGYAAGGIIRGRGTGTSDSIIARVSNGEAVIPAKSVAKNRGLVQGLIAGDLPAYAEGGFIGMPKSYARVQNERNSANAVYEKFLQSERFKNQPPENYVGQKSRTTGHSFPIFGIGGIWHKADGSDVFVKPVMDELSAMAELRGTIIARDAHGLVTPQQRVVVMKDPTDRTGVRKFLALESPLDPRLSEPTGKFTKAEYFQQLLASTLRGDKDLSADNIFGNMLPDVGPAGVFNRASGIREYEPNMPSIAEQATINLLGVKGGAKKAFAQNTADLVRSMTPEEYSVGMRSEIDRVLPRLEQTINSLGLNEVELPIYKAMITRLQEAKTLDWTKFYQMHTNVQAPKPSQSEIQSFAKGGIVGESVDPSSAVVAFGAHQPFTTAHEMIARMGMDLAAKKGSQFKQFSTAQGKSKRSLLSDALKTKLISESIGITPQITRDPYSLMESLALQGIKDVTLLLGQDRMTAGVFDLAAVEHGVKLTKIAIPREPGSPSGTETRLAISNNDTRRYQELIASGATQSTKDQVFKEMKAAMEIPKLAQGGLVVNGKIADPIELAKSRMKNNDPSKKRDQLSYRYSVKTNPETNGPMHAIEAIDIMGETRGSLDWDRDSGEILMVWVEEGLRRMGIASDMWHAANLEALKNPSAIIHPVHSPEISNDGASFRDSVGGANLMDTNWVKERSSTYPRDQYLKTLVKDNKFARGGMVSGPGTGTSDSIFAMLSNGEAVIPAKSVARNPELVKALISDNIPGFSQGVVLGEEVESLVATGMAKHGGQRPAEFEQVLRREINDILVNTQGEVQEMLLGQLKIYIEESKTVAKKTMNAFMSQNKNIRREGAEEGDTLNLRVAYNKKSADQAKVGPLGQNPANVMGSNWAHAKEAAPVLGRDLLADPNNRMQGEHRKRIEAGVAADPNYAVTMGSYLGFAQDPKINAAMKFNEPTDTGKFIKDFQARGPGKWEQSVEYAGLEMENIAEELKLYDDAVTQGVLQWQQMKPNAQITSTIFSEIEEEARTKILDKIPVVGTAFGELANTAGDMRYDDQRQLIKPSKTVRVAPGISSIPLDQLQANAAAAGVKKANMPAETGAGDMGGYIDGAKSVTTPQDDPFKLVQDETKRSSPHHDAFDLGAQDQESYNQGAESVPPPSEEPAKKLGLVQRAKIKVASMAAGVAGQVYGTRAFGPAGGVVAGEAASAITDKGLTMLSNGFEKLKTKIGAFGQALTIKGNNSRDVVSSIKAGFDSRLNVTEQLPDFDPKIAGKITDKNLKIISAAVVEQENTLSRLKDKTIKVVDQTSAAQEEMVTNTKDSLLNLSDELEQALAEAEKNSSDIKDSPSNKRNRLKEFFTETNGRDEDGNMRRGVLNRMGGTQGVKRSMGAVAAAVGMATMVPGEVGKAAQAAMGPISAATAAMSLIPGPAGLVAGGLALVATTTMAVIDMLIQNRKKAQELQENLSTSNKAMAKYAEFSKKVTGSEVMDKRRESQLGLFNYAPGKKSFGVSFMESEGGKQLLDAVGQEAKTERGIGSAQTLVTNQLLAAVTSGALTSAQARSVSAALGKEMGDQTFAMKVTGDLLELLGPNGENLTQDPLKLRLDVVTQNSNILDGIESDIANITADGANGWDAVFDHVTFGIGRIVRFQNNLNMAAGRWQAQAQALIQSSQQQIDSLDLEYEKRIKNLYAAGKVAEAEELTNKHLADRKTLMEVTGDQAQARIDAVNAANNDWGFFGAGQQNAMSDAANDAIKKAYEGTAFAAQAELVRSQIDSTKGDKGQQVELKNLVAGKTLGLNQAALGIELFGKSSEGMDQLVSLITEMGDPAAANTALSLASLFSNKADARQFIIDVQARGTEGKALIDAMALVKSSGVNTDMNLIVTYFQKNPDVALQIKKDIDAIKNEKEITQTIITKHLGKEAMDAIKTDQAYFDGLDKENQIVYLTNLATTIELNADPEFLADKALWEAKNRKVSIPEYNAILANEVTQNRMAVNKPADAGNKNNTGGSGPSGSWLDEVVKKTRDLYKANQQLTIGYKASGNALAAFYKKGKTALTEMQGMQMQLANAGLGRDIISQILGMPKEEAEKWMKMFLKKGVVTDFAKEVNAIMYANKAGDYIAETKLLTNEYNNQVKATSALTAAGIDGAHAQSMLNDENMRAILYGVTLTGSISDQIKKVKDLTRANIENLALENLKKDPRQREIDRAGIQIDAIQKENAIYQNGLEIISKQEEKISAVYDKQIAALNEVKTINDQISRQKQGELDLADALSRGDIGAAAKAAQQLRTQNAQDAAEAQTKALEDAKKRALAAISVEIDGKKYTRLELTDKIGVGEEAILKIQKDQIVQQEAALANDRLRLDYLVKIKEAELAIAGARQSGLQNNKPGGGAKGTGVGGSSNSGIVDTNPVVDDKPTPTAVTPTSVIAGLNKIDKTAVAKSFGGSLGTDLAFNDVSTAAQTSKTMSGQNALLGIIQKGWQAGLTTSGLINGKFLDRSKIAPGKRGLYDTLKAEYDKQLAINKGIGASFDANRQNVIASLPQEIQNALNILKNRKTDSASLVTADADAMKAYRSTIEKQIGFKKDGVTPNAITAGDKEIVSNARSKYLSDGGMELSLFNSRISQIERLLASSGLSKERITSLIGQYASGGYISGPGTQTSDSIPAMLSDGEYVVKASSVDKIGTAALDYMNKTGRVAKFAIGGMADRRDAAMASRAPKTLPKEYQILQYQEALRAAAEARAAKNNPFSFLSNITGQTDRKLKTNLEKINEFTSRYGSMGPGGISYAKQSSQFNSSNNAFANFQSGVLANDKNFSMESARIMASFTPGIGAASSLANMGTGLAGGNMEAAGVGALGAFGGFGSALRLGSKALNAVEGLQRTTAAVAKADNMFGKFNKKTGLSANILGTSKGYVESYFTSGQLPTFHKGGMVPGNFDMPIMAKGGEFVMSEYAVKQYGTDTMGAMNSGNAAVLGDSVYNYSVNVNVANTGANPNDIARTVMAQIRQIDSQRIRSNVL
jgi:TP901 family phage tail tape measure protein